jgi:hypothetical protein
MESRWYVRAMVAEDSAARVRQMAREADEGWGPAYGRFAAIVARFDLKVGAEIGVAFGGHAESLLRETSTELLYGIDPYEYVEGYADPTNLPQDEFDALHDFVLRRLATFGDRFRLLRTTSLSAAAEIEGTLDYVYVDAVHTCEGVWQDLKAWGPRLRTGSVLGGHDYGHPDFPGVGRAVDELCRRADLELHEEGAGVWWVRLSKPLSELEIGDFDCRARFAWRTRLASFLRL